MPGHVPQHVYLCLTGRWHQSVPGLLIAWRRGTQAPVGWEGYVISADTYPTGGDTEVTVSMGWHRAEHIRPLIDLGHSTADFERKLSAR